MTIMMRLNGIMTSKYTIDVSAYIIEPQHEKTNNVVSYHV